MIVGTGLSRATPIMITDMTPGGATTDGTIGGGEYAGFGPGVNSGFGDVWGRGSQLHLDSDIAGNLYFGFREGPAMFNDVGVIYIDSVMGGFSDTMTLTDNMDLGRAAISGVGTAMGV